MMVASSPLYHICISPLKILVDSSQEKLEKINLLEYFVSVKLPGFFLLGGGNPCVAFL